MIFEFDPWADRHPEEQSKARVSSALFKSLQTTTSGTLPRAEKSTCMGIWTTRSKFAFRILGIWLQLDSRPKGLHA